MRTTVTIDDALFQQALASADPGSSKSEMIREALKAYVRVQAARRLAALGGTMPDIKHVPRRCEPPRLR